jgi:hypothetical protein
MGAPEPEPQIDGLVTQVLDTAEGLLTGVDYLFPGK